jgi:hypothetical protein
MRPGETAWERVMRHNVTDSVRELMRTFAQPFDSYRPELHYMRGPGPKWRANRAVAAESTASTARTAITALAIAEARA